MVEGNKKPTPETMHASLTHKSQSISGEENLEKFTRNFCQVEGLARAKIHLLFTHTDSFPSPIVYLFIFIYNMHTQRLHRLLNTLLFIANARFFLEITF